MEWLTLTDEMRRAHLRQDFFNLEEVEMATQLCQKCKQAHPGRVCDYDEKGECAETTAISVAQPRNEPKKDQED
jgi:hypothetical protein